MRGIEFREVSAEYRDSVEISKLRTSISRAYYALYHHIKEKWRELGWETQFLSVVQHDKLKDILNNIDEYSSIYSNFDMLQKSRRNADYILRQSMDSNIERRQIPNEALKALDAATKQFNECDHAVAKEQIIEYRRRTGQSCP